MNARTRRARNARAVFRPALLLLALGFAIGCGNRVETRTDFENEPGEVHDAVTQRTTLRSEGDLEKADRLVRESDYDGAIVIFRNLYRNAPDPDVRARSLYGWARAEGHLLNPKRDIDAAIARLELLLEEFPDSDVAFRAREEAARMRSWRAQEVPQD